MRPLTYDEDGNVIPIPMEKIQLIEQIKTKRQQEIANGDNAYTTYPIYVIFETTETVCEYDSEYSQSTTRFSEGSSRYIRVDSDGNEIEVRNRADVDEDWNESITVIDGYGEECEYGPVLKVSQHDRFVTFTFTREAAEDFIAIDRHNLRNPRIWVDHIPYKNIELTEVCKLLGDPERW